MRAAGPQIGALLQGAAELALLLSAASSGIMGISVAVVELKRGAHTVLLLLLYQQPPCSDSLVSTQAACFAAGASLAVSFAPTH